MSQVMVTSQILTLTQIQFSPFNWDNVSTSCYMKMRRFLSDRVGFVPVKVKSREIP